MNFKVVVWARLAVSSVSFFSHPSAVSSRSHWNWLYAGFHFNRAFLPPAVNRESDINLPISVLLQHCSNTVSYGFFCVGQMRIDIHFELPGQKPDTEIRISDFLSVELDPRHFSLLGKLQGIIIFVRDLCHAKKRFQL